jgi:cytochrome c-type biogenesis protein CcmH/NrfG
MMLTDRSFAIRWTRERAALLAFFCLAVGTAGGWAVRAMRSPVKDPAAASATASAPQKDSSATDPGLKQMADAQAAPLMEKLRSDPENAALLTALGNVYYDAHEYPTAVDFYARVLHGKPADAAVRTDMGTAYWFMGNADRAIAEFEKALNYVPDNPNTLFNLGLVKWKGKMDAAGAIAAWERLLKTDPTYEQKGQVEEMLAAVKKHTNAAREAR